MLSFGLFLFCVFAAFWCSNFNLKASDEGLKQIKIEADDISFTGINLENKKAGKSNEKIRARGDVQITKNDGSVIKAKEIFIDKGNNIVEAFEDVYIKQENGDEIESDYLLSSLDKDDRKREMFVDTPFFVARGVSRTLYIKGLSMSKNSNNISKVKEATVSGCSFTKCKTGILPWSIKSEEIEYNKNTNKMKFTDLTFNFYNIPVFYTPYFSVNLNNKRKYINSQKLIMLQVQTGYYININALENKEKGYNFTIEPEVYGDTFVNNLVYGNKKKTFTESGLKAITRQNVLGLHFNYKVPNSSNMFSIGTKFTKDYIPDEKTGIVSTDKKSTRYYFDTDGSFNFGKNSSKPFKSEYDLNNLYFEHRYISDVYFKGKYDGIFDNYLSSKTKYQNKTMLSVFTAESIYFTPVALARVEESPLTRPTILPKLSYKQNFGSLQNKKTGLDSLTIDSQLMSIKRDVGNNTNRILNDISYSTPINTFGYNFVTLKGSLKNDMYFVRNKLAIGDSQDASYNRNSLDLSFDSSVPFTRKFSTAVLTIEPRFVAFYNPSKLNNRGIPVEDSLAGFTSGYNLFSENRFSGYDVREDGFRYAYGVFASSRSRDDPGKKVTFMLGKRYNNYNSVYNNTIEKKYQTNYVGLFDLQYGSLSFNNNFVLSQNSNKSNQSSTNKRFDYLLSSVSVKPLDFLTLYASRSIINRSLFLSENISNISGRSYGYRFDLFNGYSFSNTYTISDLFSASNPDNKIGQVLTKSLSLGYSSGCIFFNLIVSSVNITQNVSQPAEQIAFEFRIIGF